MDDYNDSLELRNSIIDSYELAKISNADIGETVTYGNYNGSIEWIVLDKKDNSVFVASKYAIEKRPYNIHLGPMTWEECSLRNWMNETFFASAFSENEQARIVETTNVNMDNAMHDTDGGNDTVDRVFLLSLGEVLIYFRTENSRKAVLSDGTQVSWWIRLPGGFSNCAADIGFDGSVSKYGVSVDDYTVAVRPAMWIDISNIE